MNSTELYWAAGFLEGEGSFLWSSGGTPCVSAVQKQSECLDRLRALFGGRVGQWGKPYMTKLGLSSPCFRWQLNSQVAVGLMMTLYGLLSLKRKLQIATALGEWRVRPNAKKYRRTCPQGHPYDEQNTRLSFRANGSAFRQCRLCHTEAHRSYRSKHELG